MNHVLILLRSITQAQRAAKALGTVGITSRVQRAPLGLSGRGCSYCIRIDENYLIRSLSLLREHRVTPLNIYQKGRDGRYHEVETL